MPKRLMITVDVEAQPKRAEESPVDRLIWGVYPEARGGISEMMDTADRYGMTLVMFLDYCEEYIYGEELTRVGQEIFDRGHDLQLHAHAEFLPKRFWKERGLTSERPPVLTEATDDQADALFDFLCDRHEAITGRPALGYRSGGYRYGPGILRAMKRKGVSLDSSYISSRAGQPLALGRMPQFRWDNGVLELPVTSINPYRNLQRDVHFNFNFGGFRDADRMLEYLTGFYDQLGEDAIAVLVLHSWSFSKLQEDGFFSPPLVAHLERFAGFLAGIEGAVEVVTVPQVLALAARGEILTDHTVAIQALADELSQVEGES